MGLIVMSCGLKGAEKAANSHIVVRGFLGSMMSSIQKDAADRRGDRNLFNLTLIFYNSA